MDKLIPLANFKNTAPELKVHVKIAQDIHAQEAMHRAFRREIMADNPDIFQFSAKDIILRMPRRNLWAGCLRNTLNRYCVYAAAFFDKLHLYLYCAPGDGLLTAWSLIYPAYPQRLRAIHVENFCAIFEYLQRPFLSPRWNISIYMKESQDDFTAFAGNAAGESGVIVLHVQSANSKYVRVGDIELNYNR